MYIVETRDGKFIANQLSVFSFYLFGHSICTNYEKYAPSCETYRLYTFVLSFVIALNLMPGLPHVDGDAVTIPFILLAACIVYGAARMCAIGVKLVAMKDITNAFSITKYMNADFFLYYCGFCLSASAVCIKINGSGKIIFGMVSILFMACIAVPQLKRGIPRVIAGNTQATK